MVDKLDVRVGDTVVVEKAGEIIPQVVKVVTEARTGAETKITFPPTCPVCGGKVEQRGVGRELRLPMHERTGLPGAAHQAGSCPSPAATRMDVDGLGERWPSNSSRPNWSAP